VYSEFAAGESMRYPHVYVDPHFLRIDSLEETTYMYPQNGYNDQMPIRLVCNELITSTRHAWQVPDLWTHLAITTAYASVRPSDISELRTLITYILRNPHEEHPNKEVVKYYLSHYLANFGPLLDFSRAIYASLFSEEFRDNVQLRNRLSKKRLREPRIYNYQKKDPVYF
jgi:hypothetical protein